MNKRRQHAMQAHREDDGRFKRHPGFDGVKASMAERIEAKNPKLSPAAAEQQAAAELAAATRRASTSAKRENSHLKRVK